MISTKEALEIVLSNTQSWGSVSVGLSDCIDRILAVDILADRPFPPFDRVTMDGVAINYTAFQKGQRVFTTAGIAAAGAAQLTLDNTDHCIEIITTITLMLKRQNSNQISLKHLHCLADDEIHSPLEPHLTHPDSQSAAR